MQRSPPTSNCRYTGVKIALFGLVLSCAVGVAVAKDFHVGGRILQVADDVPAVPSSWPGWQYKWRDDRFNHWLCHLQFHMIPNFTETGFEIAKIPEALWREMHALLEEHVNQPGLPKDQYVNIVDNGEVGADFVKDKDGLFNRVHRAMLKVHEAWAGVPLRPTSAFGLRVYRRGNTLRYHVDRVESHIISSIMHVGRKVDKPWLIHILDNTGKVHAVDIQPGEMLFYESARLAHFRPEPLDGDYYASLFVHYAPVDWKLGHADMLKALPHNWADGTTFERPADDPAKHIHNSPTGAPTTATAADEF